MDCVSPYRSKLWNKKACSFYYSFPVRIFCLSFFCPVTPAASRPSSVQRRHQHHNADLSQLKAKAASLPSNFPSCRHFVTVTLIRLSYQGVHNSLEKLKCHPYLHIYYLSVFHLYLSISNWNLSKIYSFSLIFFTFFNIPCNIFYHIHLPSSTSLGTTSLL